MKSKHLQKLAMILSCIGLTYFHSTQTFQVEATYGLSGGPLGTRSVDLTIIEEKLVRDHGWNDQLAQKLFTAFNDAGPLFYSFPVAPMQIIDRTLTVQAMVMSFTFRIERPDEYETYIHILEPGIENSVYIKLISNNFQAEEVCNVWNDWKQLLDIVPGEITSVHSADGDFLYNMSNLNQIPELIHTLNFSCFLAKQTNRSVDDIREFLSVLGSKRPFFANEAAIRRNLKPRHYSLNLHCGSTLMAVLYFMDESNHQWLMSNKSMDFFVDDKWSMFPVKLTDGKRFILQSITLGTHIYEPRCAIDLTQSMALPAINRAIGFHIFTIFSKDSLYSSAHRRMDELYNQINLGEVMRSIENEFGVGVAETRSTSS